MRPVDLLIQGTVGKSNPVCCSMGVSVIAAEKSESCDRAGAESEVLWGI